MEHCETCKHFRPQDEKHAGSWCQLLSDEVPDPAWVVVGGECLDGDAWLAVEPDFGCVLHDPS